MLRVTTSLLSKSGPARDSAAGVARRLSGVQRDVLALYRGLWRAAGRKSDPAVRAALRRHIRSEFEAHRDIPRRDIDVIEWRIRNGKQRLELLESSKPTDGFATFGSP